MVNLNNLIILSLPFFVYIDPGTGSMLLQLLLGGIAGFWVVFKLWGKRILSFFGKGKKQDDMPPTS